MEKVNLSTGEKLKETCRDYAKFSYEKDGTHGFSWQQINYTCSFCKKEFKSAQALGGHMNIHRRDRARMRLSPSLDGLNSGYSEVNPSFNSSSSPFSAAMFLPCKSQSSSSAGFSSPISSASTTATTTTNSAENVAFVVSQSECENQRLTWVRRHLAKNLNKRALLEVKELPVLTERNDTRVWKKKEVARLDINMGFFRDAKDDHLDLELRLGLS